MYFFGYLLNLTPPQLMLFSQGETSFFLQPGERLEQGIQDIYILSEEEGLLLRALRVLDDLDEVGGTVPMLKGGRQASGLQ